MVSLLRIKRKRDMQNVSPSPALNPFVCPQAIHVFFMLCFSMIAGCQLQMLLQVLLLIYF